MQIVINIPEEQYSLIMQSHRSGVECFVEKEAMMYAIKNGTPLPKGHGRLKDVDWIDDNCVYHHSDEDGSWCYTLRDVENAPTIIEADKTQPKTEVLDKIRAEQDVGATTNIKALEQEPCEDVISRQAAQAKIKSICDEYRLSYEDGDRKAATGGSAYALGHAFDDIPSVNPQRWIPVSERWPEDYDWVVVCFASGCVTTGYHCTDNNVYPSEFEDCDETGWYDCDEEFMCDQDVIAWMPFPKSYKAEV